MAKKTAKTTGQPPSTRRSGPDPKAAHTTGNGRRTGSGKATKSTEGGRRRGPRGAAPWTLRHAAKHAAETAARHNEPVLPGSARATLRVPAEADRIKERVLALHEKLASIRTLSKTSAESFFEIGELLAEIEDEKLYEAKGYSSFEACVERELGLGKATAARLAEMSRVFVRDAALKYGYQAISAALGALEAASDALMAPRAGRSAPAALPKKPPPQRR
jgi:hypothetical protein